LLCDAGGRRGPATGHAAPASLAALRQKAERFDTVIDPAQIAEVALGYQA